MVQGGRDIDLSIHMIMVDATCFEKVDVESGFAGGVAVERHEGLCTALLQYECFCFKAAAGEAFAA